MLPVMPMEVSFLAEEVPAGGGLGQPPHRTWRDRRGWRALAVVAGVVLLFYCAQREAHQLGVQSDGAAMMLESWSMLHGNLLLRGWQLSDVSLYTTELHEYIGNAALKFFDTNLNVTRSPQN